MTLAFEVLGLPAQDNALLVRVQTGRATHRLLLDCGAGCVSRLAVSEVQAIDHLLFTHLHMDHGARRKRHLTAGRAGELAARAGVRRLVLYHISRRYSAAELPALLDEARAAFPDAELPKGWEI